MSSLSRRDFLERLSAAYAAMLTGCHKTTDWFEKERVCIHVFNPQETLPAPLLQKTTDTPSRSVNEDLFGVGLPELVLCTTKTRFLDLFPYFWPFSRDDFKQLEQSIEILYDKKVLSTSTDLDDFESHLRRQVHVPAGLSSVVIFTFNDFTRHLTPRLVDICRQAKIGELVLFKDPTRDPYLCEYPAKQGGFKRPPP